MTVGDVVWVPFPYVEEGRVYPRPALIVATGLGGDMNLFWGLMITSATNAAWPGDVLIEDHEAAGLPVLSRIRTAKIATLSAALASKLGRVSDSLLIEVRLAMPDLSTRARP